MSAPGVSSAAAGDEVIGGCLRGADGGLRLGGVRLSDLAAADDAGGAFGTPSYVYALDAMAAEAREIDAAFAGAAHLVAYALKANSAGAVVRALAAAGCGADVVSGAELELALGCGIAPGSIVFNGVAKTDAEIDLSIGRGIGSLQVESVEEIDRVAARARALGRRARIGLRVNPGLDKELLGTHDHVATGHDEAKFGIARSDLPRALARCQAQVALVQLAGIANHIGSQLTTVEPYARAAADLCALAAGLRGVGGVAPELAFVDCGGGFGVDYGQGPGARPAEFVRAAREAQRRSGLEDLALYVEPGRSLVAAHGVLLATVLQEKRSGARRWVFVDAGMNDLVRPAMYGSQHRVVPLETGASPSRSPSVWARIAGPVCESSDDFGVHPFPEVAPHQVALLDAGAYGFTMASRYNGRALPAEVFLSAGQVQSSRRREAPGAWTRDRLL